jgi:hypothetical protein
LRGYDPKILAKIRLLSRQRRTSLGKVASELLAAAHGGKLAAFDGSLAPSIAAAAAAIELLRD